MQTPLALPDTLQKILLICGILAALLYLVADLLPGKLLPGYSFSAQSMGDLGAAGSPVRPLVVTLTLLACACMVAFGLGVWRAAGPALLPRLVAGLILGNAVFGLLGSLFFPNRYGVRPEFATPGVLLMFLSVLCFVLAMVFGALAFSGWMRLLSIAIPLGYVVLALLRFATAAAAQAGAMGLIGTQERTMAYSYLLWTLALAVSLLVQSSPGSLSGK